jgi:hypothetical protein
VEWRKKEMSLKRKRAEKNDEKNRKRVKYTCQECGKSTDNDIIDCGDKCNVHIYWTCNNNHKRFLCQSCNIEFHGCQICRKNYGHTDGATCEECDTLLGDFLQNNRLISELIRTSLLNVSKTYKNIDESKYK